MRAALRHPMVVVTVALVCLSGWCMTTSAVASPGPAASPPHAQHHAQAAQDGLAAADHDAHAAHCGASACCRAVAKESPRERGLPAISEAVTAVEENPLAPVLGVVVLLSRDDGGPPVGFAAPLTC